MFLKNLFKRRSAKQEFVRAKSEFEVAAAALTAASKSARASGKMVTPEMVAAGEHLKLAQQQLSQAGSKLNQTTGGPPPVALTEAVSRKIQVMFPTEQQPEVAHLLEKECGRNLPFHEQADPQSLERVRLAVLKLSQGDFEELKKHVEIAKVDWRDVLVSQRRWQS